MNEPIKTRFYNYHLQHKARMVEFAGFVMPIQYKGITAEHLAVRSNVGMFDLSHMGEFEVAGTDATAFLQKTTTNNVELLAPGQIQYSCMTLPTGGIVDDLLVYRLEDSYYLVVNAANLEKDFNWLTSQIEGDVQLINHSDQTSLLAIQGPNAEKVMSRIADANLANMGYYSWVRADVAGCKVMFSRTGYTGEDGFEVYIPPEHTEAIWKAAMAAGADFDMELIGLGARDTLRLEMKMALYGNDIDETTTPIEAGLAFICDLSKDFIGKDVIAAQKHEKPKRRLVCLELTDRAIPRHGFPIFDGDTQIGQVTSGTFSPSLQRPIALGYVSREKSKAGSEVLIGIRDKKVPAIVVKPPFYKDASHK
jgi:aminomethyltransferase